MNLKKAALVAAVCTILGFDPVAYFGLNSVSMAPWAHVGGLRQAVLIWALLRNLALAAFLVAIFLEQSGRITARPRRVTAGVAAVLMGVQVALACVLVLTPALIASYGPRALALAIFGVAARALWVALLSCFALRDNPYQRAVTRGLALVLAAETAVGGLNWVYASAPMMFHVFSWPPDAWGARGNYSAERELLAIVAVWLTWISVLVFLLSVWRFQARAAEAVDGHAASSSC